MFQGLLGLPGLPGLPGHQLVQGSPHACGAVSPRIAFPSPCILAPISITRLSAVTPRPSISESSPPSRARARTLTGRVLSLLLSSPSSARPPLLALLSLPLLALLNSSCCYPVVRVVRVVPAPFNKQSKPGILGHPPSPFLKVWASASSPTGVRGQGTLGRQHRPALHDGCEGQMAADDSLKHWATLFSPCPVLPSTAT